jgi:hypothetical protein
MRNPITFLMFCALLWALPAEAQYRESVADKIEKAGRAACYAWRGTPR